MRFDRSLPAMMPAALLLFAGAMLDTIVLQTVVGGRIVYQSGQL